MQANANTFDQGNYARISDHKCPLCQGHLIRTPRRAKDRLRCIFAPARRYRCDRFSCQWVGNLAAHSRAIADATSDSAWRTVTRSGFESRPRKIPISFVVHMVLAGVGMVLVLIIATTDLLQPIDAAELASREWDRNGVTHLRSAQSTRLTEANPAGVRPLVAAADRR